MRSRCAGSLGIAGCPRTDVHLGTRGRGVYAPNLQSAQEEALSMGGACGSWGRGLACSANPRLCSSGAVLLPLPDRPRRGRSGTRVQVPAVARRYWRKEARGGAGGAAVIVSPRAMRQGTMLGMVSPRGQGQGHKSGCACLPVREDCEWETLSPRSPCTRVHVVLSVA